MASNILPELEKECRHYAGLSLCNWLQSAYLGWGLSERMIGEMLGVSRQSVSNWLKYYNIDARPRGEMSKLVWLGYEKAME